MIFFKILLGKRGEEPGLPPPPLKLAMQKWNFPADFTENDFEMTSTLLLLLLLLLYFFRRLYPAA